MDDNFDPATRSTASIARLTERHAPSTPRSRDGAQQTASPRDGAGIFAFIGVDARRQPGRVRGRAQQRRRRPRPRRSRRSGPRRLVFSASTATDHGRRAGRRRAADGHCPAAVAVVWKANKPISAAARRRRLDDRARRPAGAARGRAERGRRHATPYAVTFFARPADRTGRTSAPTTTRRTASSTTSPASPRHALEYRASSRMPRVASPRTRPRRRWSSRRPRPCPSSATRRPPSPAPSRSPAR